jgi:hypothetical protein
VIEALVRVPTHLTREIELPRNSCGILNVEEGGVYYCADHSLSMDLSLTSGGGSVAIVRLWTKGQGELSMDLGHIDKTVSSLKN